MTNQIYKGKGRTKPFEDEVPVKPSRDERTTLGRMLGSQGENTMIYDKDFMDLYDTVVEEMTAEQHASEKSNERKSGPLADYSFRNATYKDRTINIVVPRATLDAPAD